MLVETKLDDELRAGTKMLRTQPRAYLLGPTGARLWADYLNPEPGFAGRFDFIHKVNIPLLFQVTANLTDSFEPCRTEWHPSHLRMVYEDHRLYLVEQKFITWDDCAVSCQTWTNRSQQELVLRLVTDELRFPKLDGDFIHGRIELEHYSFIIKGVIAVSDPALLMEVRVKPGETKQLIVAAAYGIEGQDLRETLIARASVYTRAGRTVEETVRHQQQTYERWFKEAPAFLSSDPVLNKTWTYRWFVLRHNAADPKYGHLQHPLFYEGRSHKKSKKPFGKGGWEFSKLINLSVPLHIMDARWHHDPAFCEGALRNMKESPGEDGMFRCLTVDTIMHSFANFSCWAAYQLYLVHGNDALAAELLPAMKNNIAAWNEVHGSASDHLMIEHKHTRTGKEYQPSYWYFHDFPKNPKDKTTYTHLKRVDRAVYHYLNTLAVARLCEASGDPEAGVYAKQAELIKQDILDKMWDEATQYFYDLHYETDEMAMVRNIVGIYPGWAQLIDDTHNGMIEHLLDEEAFLTPCPFPTVSIDCPAYSKDGGWRGTFVKGRNGCVWDGPSWPYTNSIALDALAKESKRRGHAFDRSFGHLLREYSFLHFMNRDLSQPGIVEHYNSETGEPLSDEQEYNHSYYIDLIISHVAGLSIGQEGIVLDPIHIGLDYFSLDRVKVQGSELRITYKSPGTVAPELPELEAGYCLYVDGKLVFHQETLGRQAWTWEQWRGAIASATI